MRTPQQLASESLEFLEELAYSWVDKAELTEKQSEDMGTGIAQASYIIKSELAIVAKEGGNNEENNSKT